MNESGYLLGAQAGQLGNYANAQQGVGQQITGPVTLNRAMAAIDTLNKRLSEVSSRAHKLAAVIGGPIPVQSGSNFNPNVEKQTPTVMQALNDQVDNAARLAIDIQQALDAISRSLGVTSAD